MVSWCSICALSFAFGIFFLGSLLLTLFFDLIVRKKTGQFTFKSGESIWSVEDFVKILGQVLMLAALQLSLSIVFLMLFGVLYYLQYPDMSNPFYPHYYSDIISDMLYTNGEALAFFIVNCSWGLYYLYTSLKHLKKL